MHLGTWVPGTRDVPGTFTHTETRAAKLQFSPPLRVSYGESFVVGGGRGSDKQNQRRSEPASAGSLSHKRLRPITLSLTLRAHTQTSTDSELEFSPNNLTNVFKNKHIHTYTRYMKTQRVRIQRVLITVDNPSMRTV